MHVQRVQVGGVTIELDPEGPMETFRSLPWDVASAIDAILALVVIEGTGVVPIPEITRNNIDVRNRLVRSLTMLRGNEAVVGAPSNPAPVPDWSQWRATLIEAIARWIETNGWHSATNLVNQRDQAYRLAAAIRSEFGSA